MGQFLPNLVDLLIFCPISVNNAIDDFTNSGVGQLCFACRLADNLINGGHRGWERVDAEGEQGRQDVEDFGRTAHERDMNLGNQWWDNTMDFGRQAQNDVQNFGRQAHEDQNTIRQQNEDNFNNFGRDMSQRQNQAYDSFLNQARQDFSDFGNTARQQFDNFGNNFGDW